MKSRASENAGRISIRRSALDGFALRRRWRLIEDSTTSI
jgi:hypothetical protein